MLRYLDKDNLLPTFQSGFRKGHSMETLLVRLLSDIYGAIDRSQVILLALFAVSTRRLKPSITISFLGAYLPRLAFLVTFLTGLFPASITVPSLRSTCLLGLHVFLSRLACPRNLCWALFSNYIIYTADTGPLLASC